MKHMLANKIRYMPDKEVTKSITEDTHDIPMDLDNATKLILNEIGEMGMKIRNKEG